MLKGKAAVITGSTRGIGFAIAEALCAQGCGVMLNGFADQDQIEVKMKGLRDKYAVKVEYDPANLKQFKENERLVQATVDASAPWTFS